MLNDTMVTVMVTFYNQKSYIKDSLEAIFSQKTNFEFEVLCGDDGSSDGTYEELLYWEQQYPEKCRVYQRPRECGKTYEPIVRVSENRVNLLKHAKGKYVAFLDGDDYYTDLYKLQKQVDMLEEHRECVACGHPVVMVWDNETERKEVLGHIADYPLKMSNKTYWSHLWLHADSFLYRNIYKSKESSINPKFFDDNLITAYFIKEGSVIYFPEAMVAYRQVTGSSWNRRSELQKAAVNMQVYSEAKKVLCKMKWQTFMKCYSAWKSFYKNRKTDICSMCKVDSIDEEKFVQDTIKYKNSDLFYKIIYEMKYFILLRLEYAVRVAKKIQRFKYRKIENWKG